jgi:hypothetical protein
VKNSASFPQLLAEKDSGTAVNICRFEDSFSDRFEKNSGVHCFLQESSQCGLSLSKHSPYNEKHGNP